MNIHAMDKASQKTNKITITNDKGRLTKDDIEKLVKDAEKFKAEDEILKGKIDAKNSLEQTTYSIRNTLKDEKLKDKFSAEETAKLNGLVDEAQKWIEANQNAEKE